jgi:hypothetical protein
MKLRFITATSVAVILVGLVFFQVTTLQANAHENSDHGKDCYIKITYDNHHKEHKVSICRPISFPKPPISFPKGKDHDNDQDGHHDNHR